MGVASPEPFFSTRTRILTYFGVVCCSNGSFSAYTGHINRFMHKKLSIAYSGKQTAHFMVDPVPSQSSNAGLLQGVGELGCGGNSTLGVATCSSMIGKWSGNGTIGMGAPTQAASGTSPVTLGASSSFLSTPTTSTSSTYLNVNGPIHMQSPLGAQAAHAQAQASATFAHPAAPHSYTPMDLRRTILPTSGVPNATANLSYLMSPYSMLQAPSTVGNGSVGPGGLPSAPWLGMPVADASLWMQDRSRAVIGSPTSSSAQVGASTAAAESKRGSFSSEWSARSSGSATTAGVSNVTNADATVAPTSSTITASSNGSSSSTDATGTTTSAGVAQTGSSSASATTAAPPSVPGAASESTRPPSPSRSSNLLSLAAPGSFGHLDSELLHNFLPEGTQHHLLQHHQAAQLAGQPQMPNAHPNNLQTYPMHHLDMLRGMGMGGSLSGIPGLGAPSSLASGTSTGVPLGGPRGDFSSRGRGKLNYNFRSFDARATDEEAFFNGSAAFHFAQPHHQSHSAAAHYHGSSAAAAFSAATAAAHSPLASIPGPNAGAPHPSSLLPHPMLPPHTQIPPSHLDNGALLGEMAFLAASGGSAAQLPHDSLLPPDSRIKRARSSQMSAPHSSEDSINSFGAHSSSSGESGERKFRCDVEGCHKTFKRSGHLKRHRLVHLPPNQRERYRCWKQTCNKHYSTKYDLAAHMRQAHGGVELLRCTVRNCARRFVRQESLDKHLKTFDHTKENGNNDHMDEDEEDYEEIAAYMSGGPASASTAGVPASASSRSSSANVGSSEDGPYRHLLNAAEASSPSSSMGPPPAKRISLGKQDASASGPSF